MSEFPKLRHIEMIPVETEQGKMIALRDPLAISDEMVLVTVEGTWLLQLFDGTTPLHEMPEKCRQRFGWTIEQQVLRELHDHLDRHYYLENDRFRKRKDEIIRDMLDRGAREAVHAGGSYPAEKETAQQELDLLFEKGAGRPGPVNGLPTPAGIIAPHIDLRVGGDVYTHAYRRLAEAESADTYVIIGTGHAGLDRMFSVLDLDFETPLGRIAVDHQFVKALRQRCTNDFFSDVLLHKFEHTIEFQALFLQKVLSGRPFRIVPVLASFSYHVLEYPQFAYERNLIDEFIGALRETISASPGKTTVVASVDLAHVGPRYGDEQVPDAAFLQEVKKADDEALDAALRGDADAWYRSIAGKQDRYRICGFAPVYTLLKTIDARKGELLRYDQGRMDDNESVVSYCSAVLY